MTHEIVETANELDGIYYLLAPADMTIYGKDYQKGERVWLSRAATEYSYQDLDSAHTPLLTCYPYDSPLPAAKAYQHMNYGVWVKLKDEEGDKDNTTPADSMTLPHSSDRWKITT